MSTQTSATEQPVAIIHQIVTVSVTFVEKPSDSQRQQLKDAGYRYENGKWFKSRTQGQYATAEMVGQIVAAG